jgi:NAD(P)-dependent dehydrogenase (short-subunit alcohol dehydrogenase family)
MKAAVVTGGSAGIGLACVEELLRRSFSVLFCGRGSERLEEASSRLREQGFEPSSFHAMKADMGSESGPDLVVRRCVEQFGGLDALINNAGVYEERALVDMTAEAWDETLQSNLRGPALASASAARQMIAQGRGGRIVHIASLNAVMAERGYSHYGSSKAGLISLTQAMALELGQYDIQTNAISPGWIATPMTRALISDFDSFPFHTINPLGRIGEPEEVAILAAFLCTDAPGFLNGQTINFDGGQSAMGRGGD